MKINPNTKRHGSAVALELVLEIQRINRPGFGSREARHETAKTLHAYLEGYHHANAAAKRGFFCVFGDQVASAASGCIASEPAEFYSRRKWQGGKPRPQGRERKAHARVWLRGGAQEKR